MDDLALRALTILKLCADKASLLTQYDDTLPALRYTGDEIQGAHDKLIQILEREELDRRWSQVAIFLLNGTSVPDALVNVVAKTTYEPPYIKGIRQLAESYRTLQANHATATSVAGPADDWIMSIERNHKDLYKTLCQTQDETWAQLLFAVASAHVIASTPPDEIK